MNPVVKIVYQKEPNLLSIAYGETLLDTSAIKNYPINLWIFPLSANGVKWRGLYRELSDLTNSKEFTVLLKSDSQSYDIMQRALCNTQAKLISSDNAVTVIYRENPFSTKITVNGESFDTSRIQNRSIEEWVNSIQIRDLQWNGIFQELSEYIGADTYNLYFIGKVEFMDLLIDHCPENVNVFYRDTDIAKLLNTTKTTSNNNPDSTISIPQISTSDEKPTLSEPIEHIKELIEKPQNDSALDRIPIKNKFLRQHIISICSALSILFMFLPFASFYAESAEGTSKKVAISVFNTLFGIKELKIGENKSIFGLIIAIVPILLIVTNYIKPIKNYRKYIVVFAPLVGILGEILTFFDLRKLFQTFILDNSMELKSVLGIGFFMLILLFIVIACIGTIIFYNFSFLKKHK